MYIVQYISMRVYLYLLYKTLKNSLVSCANSSISFSCFMCFSKLSKHFRTIKLLSNFPDVLQSVHLILLLIINNE